MKVIAAIVTCNPALDDLRANIAAVRPQVASVLIVDNASAGVAAVRALAAEFDCSCMENPTNLGVAAALNQAVAFARAQAADFVLFLDQDSRVSPGFVAQAMASAEALGTARIGLVTPTIRTRPDGSTHPPVRLRNGAVPVAQTSGAFMPLAVFEEVGLFREELFIDYVDYEHCLRLTARGWHIAYAPTAVLEHSPGNPRLRSFLGLRIRTVNAAHVRHYFQTRNCLWLVAHYLRLHPEITVRLLLRMVYVQAHALLFEPHRLPRLRAVLRGIADALRGRLGPYR